MTPERRTARGCAPRRAAHQGIDMNHLLDLDRYPLHGAGSPRLEELIASCRHALNLDGMFNLEHFVRPAAIAQAAAELSPRLARSAYTHERSHNVYFDDAIGAIPSEHPALTRQRSTHHTLCADQITDTIVHRIYEWLPLAAFIARVLGEPRLYLMEDPLARVNVMEYRTGETLGWHFDRSRYTTTLLIQSAQEGGEFEYASNLRSEDEPNFTGVSRLLQGGASASIRVNPLAAGTLNVFAGRHTLHRVTEVRGAPSRIVAVYSYYDRPGVEFSDAERRGFYGRTR
jgi:hypothetical protein